MQYKRPSIHYHVKDGDKKISRMYHNLFCSFQLPQRETANTGDGVRPVNRPKTETLSNFSAFRMHVGVCGPVT